MLALHAGMLCNRNKGFFFGNQSLAYMKHTSVVRYTALYTQCICCESCPTPDDIRCSISFCSLSHDVHNYIYIVRTNLLLAMFQRNAKTDFRHAPIHGIDRCVHSTTFARTVQRCAAIAVGCSTLIKQPQFFFFFIVFQLYVGSMYDDIRLHVTRSYTSSADNTFSLISSFTLSNHILLSSSLPSLMYFQFLRHPSYIVLLSPHHFNIHNRLY